jgi:hypothetical protein
MLFVWLLPLRASVKLVQIQLAQDAKAAEEARAEIVQSGEIAEMD